MRYDTTDRVLISIFIGIIALVLGGTGWFVYAAVFAESFSLYKDQWQCTHERLVNSVTTQSVVGDRGRIGVLVLPSVSMECAQWTRKDSQ